MNSYNDFPTLSEEQYLKLNKQYQSLKLNHNNLIQNIINICQMCKSSFFCLSNTNQPLSTRLKDNITSLNNVLDILYLLYPKRKANTNTISSNLFNILEELTNCLTIITQIKQNETKPLYLKMFTKIEKQIITILSNTLNTLSKQSIRFYTHF